MVGEEEKKKNSRNKKYKVSEIETQREKRMKRAPK